MQITQDVVEIDPEVVKVAKKWFDCKEDERLRIITDDGLKFINNKAAEDGMYAILELPQEQIQESSKGDVPNVF